MLDTRKYDVYGAVRAGGAGTRHRFIGQLGHTSEDETGLLYMQARYCDPVAGRFVSEDPARDGGNWFAYASADPTNASDPTGLFLLFDVVIGSVCEDLRKAYDGLEARAAEQWGENAIFRALAKWSERYPELWAGEFKEYAVNQAGTRIDLIGMGGKRIAIDFSGHGGAVPHLNAYGPLGELLGHSTPIASLL